MLDEYSDMIDNNLMNLHLMFMSTDDMPSNKTNYIIKFIGPAILDRERKNFYKLKMVATDAAGLSSEAQLVRFLNFTQFNYFNLKYILDNFRNGS